MYRRKSYKKRKNKISKIELIVAIVVLVTTCFYQFKEKASDGEYGDILSSGTFSKSENSDTGRGTDFNFSAIPEYSGQPIYVLNNNHAEFSDEEYLRAEQKYLYFSPLDKLGRCGVCEGSLGMDTLATEERSDISHIRPSGWVQESYPDIIENNNGWLYNRCHLLMFAMTGNNAEENIITGTEYFNTKSMLPYEKAVHNWIVQKAQDDRVIYRVTPIFVENELVARGVHIEAADVSTRGEQFHVNVFCYNVEPGIEIDYETGSSKEL